MPSTKPQNRPVVSLGPETEITEKILMLYLGELGVLLRNTKFNAESAEPAEKNPLKLCDLCVQTS